MIKHLSSLSRVLWSIFSIYNNPQHLPSLSSDSLHLPPFKFLGIPLGLTSSTHIPCTFHPCTVIIAKMTIHTIITYCTAILLQYHPVLPLDSVLDNTSFTLLKFSSLPWIMLSNFLSDCPSFTENSCLYLQNDLMFSVRISHGLLAKATDIHSLSLGSIPPPTHRHTLHFNGHFSRWTRVSWLPP